MTALALTTATVVDRPLRARRTGRPPSGRSLADAIRAYYVTKVSALALLVGAAMGVGAVIGRL